ncbi:MAG: aminotransferase class I/II-fold pyridoxal phosphate-dependent enzyme [Vampirovibrionales bacterium]
MSLSSSASFDSCNASSVSPSVAAAVAADAVRSNQPAETTATSSTATANTLPFAAKQVTQLPLYVFAELARIKNEVRASGMELVDLGMGNPDRPTPPLVLEALQQAIADPANHAYPDFEGKQSFRDSVCHFMQRRYNVSLCSKTEVQPLIGSKEGIANIILGYLDEGETILVPSLYYPVYMRAASLASADIHYLPMHQENDFLIDLDAIPESVAKRAKMLLLNYPNNPTGVEAPRAFLQKVVDFCRKYHIVLVSDMAYGEIAYDGYQPISILEIEGAKDVAIEFHSFSKTFNMAGWRLGFAVGNPQIIRTLYRAKTTMDYGVCNAIQDAGAAALNHYETLIGDVVSEYQARRDYMVPALRALGWQMKEPKASFYLWMQIPATAENSNQFVEQVMRQTGVVFTPGRAFGQAGDRYVRLSLVSPLAKLQEAVERLKHHGVYGDAYQRL